MPVVASAAKAGWIQAMAMRLSAKIVRARTDRSMNNAPRGAMRLGRRVLRSSVGGLKERRCAATDLPNVRRLRAQKRGRTNVEANGVARRASDREPNEPDRTNERRERPHQRAHDGSECERTADTGNRVEQQTEADRSPEPLHSPGELSRRRRIARRFPTGRARRSASQRRTAGLAPASARRSLLQRSGANPPAPRGERRNPATTCTTANSSASTTPTKNAGITPRWLLSA